ncbi:MAG: hypothetical protein GY769_04380 [bacterium]|nr:hypothetical protein [bacterium]
MLYLPGYYANAMRRATSFTPTPSAETLYPGSYLGHGLPSYPFKFGSVAADVEVVADISFLLNQGFEDWLGDTLLKWKEGAGAGSYAKESTTVSEGTYSLKLTGIKEMYQDVAVMTGKEYEVGWSFYGDGVSTNARFYVQDLDTYKWLHSSGSWQASKVALSSRTGASWQPVDFLFTVESGAQATTNLRIICGNIAANSVYFDDCHIIPTVDFASIHGHNIPSGAEVDIQFSDSPSSGFFSNGILTMAQPSFYAVLDHEETHRYVKLLIGTQAVGDPIWIGEWAVGHHNVLGAAMRWGWKFVPRQPRTDVRTAKTGQLLTQREAYRPSLDLVMDFIATNKADRDEMFETVIHGSEQGDEPVIMVPDEHEPEVIHGRVSKHTIPLGKVPYDNWAYSVTLEEDVFPVAGF